jgi:hypothetical protein
MRPGRPKSDNTKPARQSRARNNADTNERTGAKTVAAASVTLLDTLANDVRLSADDRVAIRTAAERGIELTDLAALTVYEIRLARAMLERDELTAREFMVALNKAGSHVAAAAQLGQSQKPSVSSVSVTFTGTGPTSEREGMRRSPTDAEVGDLIETEG